MLSLLSSHLICALLISVLVTCRAEESPSVASPTVSLNPNRETVYVGPHYVDEGSDFEITCYTTPFKNPAWTKDGIPVKSDVETTELKQNKPGESTTVVTLVVKDAKPINAGFYKCHSQAEEAHEVTIVTGIVANEAVPGEGVVVDLWKSFVLICNVTTEPAENNLTIDWFRNDGLIKSNERFFVYESNNTLFVPNTTEAECGSYVCKVNNTESNASQVITVKMRPFIRAFPKSINKVEGESVTVKCEAYGYPNLTLIWYKEEKEEGLNRVEESDRLKIVVSPTGNESVLTINDLKEDDRAEYTCSATNDVGSFNATVLIRVKDKLAALWPFLGIVAEVAVLCTIIFIYEKRRTKQEFEESDTDQSPDTKNVTENKDKEVRQRK